MFDLILVPKYCKRFTPQVNSHVSPDSTYKVIFWKIHDATIDILLNN